MKSKADSKAEGGFKGGRRKAEGGNGNGVAAIADPLQTAWDRAKAKQDAENGKAKGGKRKPTAEGAESAEGNGEGEKADQVAAGKSSPPSAFRLPPSSPPSFSDLAIEAIDANRFNPRQNFDKQELEDLAATIREHGLLQPVLVRRHPGHAFRFELVAGERRLRAAKLAGLAKIPAFVREMDDRQAREAAVLENLQRKDLSAIEEARGFRLLLEGDGAPTQQQLAERLGVSQPHVANRLRLLELPEEWQARVISGEIPATHARSLLRVKDCPAVLDQLAREIKRGKGEVGSVSDFEDDVDRAIRQKGRSLKRGDYDLHLREHVPIFKPSPEQREELEIVEIEAFGERTEYATNVKAFDRWQKPFAAEWKRKRKAEGQEKGGRRKDEGGKKTPERKLTPAQAAAQKKREEEADRKRRAEQARLTARKVHRWKIDRLRQAAAADLPKRPMPVQDRVILYLLVASETWELNGSAIWRHVHDREELLEFAVRCDSNGSVGKAPWRAVERIDDAKIRTRLVDVAAQILWSSQHGPECKLPDDVAEQIAAHLRVDLAALWPAIQKGADGKAYWELHTREQLVDLGKELGVYLAPTLDKAAMVRVMAAGLKPLKLPKELKQRGKAEGGRRKGGSAE